MSVDNWDYIIIGAGIVGLSVARELCIVMVRVCVSFFIMYCIFNLDNRWCANDESA
jgi:hypothetical protein